MSLVPEYIKNLSPYKAGKPIDEVKRELGLDKVVKLASNENPLGPPPKSVEAVRKILNDIALYPDSNGYYLRSKLAEKFNVKMENVILGAGSEGIMATIMRTFLKEEDRILATENSFIGFRVLANASGKKINWVAMKNYSYDLKAMSDRICKKTKIIYLANPDNPTGSYFNKNNFDEFIEKVPDRCLVILDEAYYEYASSVKDYPDSMHYRFDNVITLRTFSKAYGLAGLRVGYGFAHEKLISSLMKVKLPFEPSVPAQCAAIAALEDLKYLAATLTNNSNEMLRLETVFKNLNLEFIPSTANFITLIFNDESEAASFSDIFLKEGVILRHLKSFGLPECVRVTLGNKDEMNFFIKKLEVILEKI